MEEFVQFHVFNVKKSRFIKSELISDRGTFCRITFFGDFLQKILKIPK